MIQKVTKTDRKHTTPTPTTIPTIRPVLFVLLLGGSLLTLGIKSVQYRQLYQNKNKNKQILNILLQEIIHCERLVIKQLNCQFFFFIVLPGIAWMALIKGP